LDVFENEVRSRIVELKQHVATESIMKVDPALAQIFKSFGISVF
jgi:hypothetical protein